MESMKYHYVRSSIFLPAWLSTLGRAILLIFGLGFASLALRNVLVGEMPDDLAIVAGAIAAAAQCGIGCLYLGKLRPIDIDLKNQIKRYRRLKGRDWRAMISEIESSSATVAYQSDQPDSLLNSGANGSSLDTRPDKKQPQFLSLKDGELDVRFEARDDKVGKVVVSFGYVPGPTSDPDLEILKKVLES